MKEKGNSKKIQMLTAYRNNLEKLLDEVNKYIYEILNNEEKVFQIGYGYYPHEQMEKVEKFVYGTEQQAKLRALDLLREAPEWIKEQVDKNFDSKYRCKVFCLPIDVEKLN